VCGTAEPPRRGAAIFCAVVDALRHIELVTQRIAFIFARIATKGRGLTRGAIHSIGGRRSPLLRHIPHIARARQDSHLTFNQRIQKNTLCFDKKLD
jgi:hypothetical protein